MGIDDVMRDRLRQQASTRDQQSGAGEHPDADVLNAFVEQSLSHAERAGVIGHLSECGVCRQVVALAWEAQDA